MRWVCISIKTSIEAEDAISNLLMELDSHGVQIEDENRDKILLKAYFPTDDMIGQRILKIQELLENMRELGINMGSGRISIDSLDEKDWTEPWKEFFKPLSVGKRILVFPTWEIEKVNKEILPSQIPKRDILIQIDPGMAFGTGRHSTTLLCLELLEQAIKGEEKVLDIGTGSGILAIAAAKLGAVKVMAIDVDNLAVNIAIENSKLNNISEKIIIRCCDGLNTIEDKYDIIVSNISTKIILSMIPEFPSYLKNHGKLILSGILESEKHEIHNALEDNKFNILETRSQEEWTAFLSITEHS